MLKKNWVGNHLINEPIIEKTQDGSIPEPNENYMFARSTWTRATSFVPLKGNKPVILMGGELNSAGNMASAFSTAASHGMHLGLTGGNTFSDYDMLWDRGGKYNRASGEAGGSMPYRPIPGIKDISIEYKGGGMTLGATRTAEINWTCWTWEELDRLMQHFLAHGKTVFLEWGWSGNTTSLKDAKPYPLFIKNDDGFLIFNEDEIKAQCESDSFDKAIEYAKSLNMIVAITRAADGSVIVNNNEVIEVKPVKVDRVVDTTGAGDLYAGGFLFGMAKEKDLTTCGNYASIAAAEIISHYGARPLVKLSNLI